jgi:hypothetical protein
MPSTSKQQQKFMGMVHALKKGEMNPSDASPEVKKAAQSMSKKDAEDFASTKHKGLPRKVKQEIVNKLKEYANKMGTNTMGGDDYTSSKRGGLRDNDGYDNVDYNKNMPMDEAHYTAIANLGTTKAKENLDSFDELQKFMDKMKRRKAISVQVTKINNGKKQTIDYDWDGRNWVSKNKSGVQEGKLPNNWMQGRTSDYHTKLGTTPRDKYDDTNFKKDNSGQPDLEEGFNELEHLKLLNLAMKTMPGSPKQKEIIKKLNQVRISGGMKPLKENDLEDAIHQVKKFDKPKDQKLLTIKVINKLKDKRNKSNSSSNKQKLQQMIDKIEGDYKKGKFLTESPVNEDCWKGYKQVGGKMKNGKMVPNCVPTNKSIKSEYASNQTLSYLPADEEEIEKMNETMIRRAVDIAQELLPKDTFSRYSKDGQKNAEFVKNVVRDLTQSLNRFYKNHDISVRIKENEEDSNVDMVLGVLSILRQIDDKENRKRVAVDMIKKFKEQDIDFDYQEFIDLMKEYSMGSYEYNK